MVENVFRLGNKPIREFMTPLSDIVWLDIKDSIPQIKKKISDDERAVFPVHNGGTDKILGVIEANDFLISLLERGRENTDIKKLIQPVMYIDEYVPSLVAIDRLKKSFISIVMVTERNTKRIIGFISFHDILEAIVGEFNTEQ